MFGSCVAVHRPRRQADGLPTALVANAAPMAAPVAMPMIAIVRRVMEFRGSRRPDDVRVGDRAALNAATIFAASFSSSVSPGRRVAAWISSPARRLVAPQPRQCQRAGFGPHSARRPIFSTA